ncbi:hypothetical protein Hanom_Chr09g00800361 [Helianthus anomalus]
MMLGSGVIISATMLLAASGRKLGLQPISGDSDAFPMIHCRNVCTYSIRVCLNGLGQSW